MWQGRLFARLLWVELVSSEARDLTHGSSPADERTPLAHP